MDVCRNPRRLRRAVECLRTAAKGPRWAFMASGGSIKLKHRNGCPVSTGGHVWLSVELGCLNQVTQHKYNRPMTVAVLLASSRSAGNTRTLVDLALPTGEYALEDIQKLRIGFYSYDNANQSDDFLPLLDRMLKHQTWLIATPLYWYSMSAQAKVFLDRLSDLLTWNKELGRLLRGRRLAVLCSGTDPELPSSFNEPFKLTCEYLGMEFLGSHYAQFNGLYPVKPAARQEAEAFGRATSAA